MLGTISFFQWKKINIEMIEKEINSDWFYDIEIT